MFIDMIAEVRGAVPKMPFPLAKKTINRARADLYRKNLWSFLLYDQPQWIAPPLITTGVATTTQGSNLVTVNAAAAAAINAGSTTFSLITQRQFRIAAGTIYNIWDWDGINQLTLDRPYGEASIANASYTIYQVYYAAPYKDHLCFTSVRDMQNFIDLFIDKTRAQIDASDPQRTWYYFPTDVVFYQDDRNPQSTTYGWPLYELWGAPQYSLNYQLYGMRSGAVGGGMDLVANSDTLPIAIGEDCVVEYAKYYAYQWAEANKGSLPRDQGPDFKFLMGEAKAEYKRLYTDYRRRDRETVNAWFAIRRISLYGKYFSYYNSIGGTAYPGVGMGG